MAKRSNTDSRVLPVEKLTPPAPKGKAFGHRPVFLDQLPVAERVEARRDYVVKTSAAGTDYVLIPCLVDLPINAPADIEAETE